MSFKLQVNSFTQYSGQGAAAEWLGQKDNILLQQGLALESSFDTPRYDGKTTTASKGSLPRYCRLRAPPLPDELATPRTVIEVTATNRQPSKKDAFAVSID